MKANHRDADTPPGPDALRLSLGMPTSLQTHSLLKKRRTKKQLVEAPTHHREPPGLPTPPNLPRLIAY